MITWEVLIAYIMRQRPERDLATGYSSVYANSSPIIELVKEEWNLKSPFMLRNIDCIQDGTGKELVKIDKRIKGLLVYLDSRAGWNTYGHLQTYLQKTMTSVPFKSVEIEWVHAWPSDTNQWPCFFYHKTRLYYLGIWTLPNKGTYFDEAGINNIDVIP